ncbi:MAG TPA: aspartate aminotransferase family protein [Burkholderiales bacterium]|nr:aspartate aminotransferase family protein [Burkholderiales bacterium]
MNTYSRIPVAFTHGKGVWVWDQSGKKYLDALAGIAVSTLGHGHPALTRAIAEQSARLIHASNLYQIAEQEQLAEKLAKISGTDAVFFCNSGCEANEAAIKLARLYGHGKGIGSPSIVVMDKAFHGRTLATLSATGNRKVQVGFEPLVPGFVRVPLNDIAAVRQVAAQDKSVVAVLIEPIQGEGGINLSTMQYLRDLRELCDRQGWLLMVDEVQCGLGRTGKWFVYQHAGIRPDVVLLAKGLASGVPIGACLARGVAAGVFKPGTHGSTFGGNPLACAAALATLQAIEEEGLMENASRIGAVLLDGLREALAGRPGVVEVRGHGLMIGVELARPCGELVARALEAGLLINVTMDNIVRLLPPLVMNEAEARQVLAILVPLVHAFLAQAPSVAAAARA